MKLQFALGFVVFASALAPIRAASADSPLNATFLDPDSPDVAEIRQLGERAITRIASTMVSEVTAAVAKRGPEGALEKCHLKDIALSSGTVAGMPRITAMKRTSLRLRSLDNAPDAADRMALDRVDQALNAGNPPRLLVQRIDLPDGRREWRVYRPLALTKACATCHGPANEQSPQLQSALQQQFPNDAAVGYQAGEWRGLLRVTVAEAPAAIPAPTVANPSPKKKA